MKVNGKEVKRKGPMPCVIPRVPAEDNIVFFLHPVLDRKPFRDRFKEPKPRQLKKAGGAVELLFNDPIYQAAVEDYNKKFTAWLVLETLKANTDSEGTVFEKVVLDDPDTWMYWEQEMRDSGLVEGEIVYFLQQVQAANGVNVQAYESARELFLIGERQALMTSSPTDGLASTASGVPVKDGV